jgi:predicted O-methyltransferase YrrM
MHDYAKVYESLFEPVRDEAKALLEIGVGKGCSMFMWRDYFPKAKIYGIDVNDDCLEFDGAERISVVLVDQGDRQAISNYIESLSNLKFDVIIDDGGHKMSHQIVSFEEFWPHLKDGGIYVVEDTFTSFWLNSPHEYVDQEQTAIQYFQELAAHISKLNPSPGYVDFQCRLKTDVMDYYQRSVESVEFRTGLIILRKRKT